MNQREEIVFNKSKKDGWEVLNKGYPDFLLWKEKTNEAIFIEVKAKPYKGNSQGQLTKNQKKMHQVLRKLGFVVKVVYVD